MAKDLKYSPEEARQLGLTLKVAIPTIEVFEDAVKNGCGDHDLAAVIEAQRRRRSRRRLRHGSFIFECLAQRAD